MIDKTIKNVLELPGVDGACIIDKKGAILVNALPDFFLLDFLDDLSRRVISLYEAVDENYVPCDDYLLKFPQKYIQLRRNRHAYLLVTTDPTVNLISLRMVTNIVLKHTTPKVISTLRAELKAAADADQTANPPVAMPELAPSHQEMTPEPQTESPAPIQSTPPRRALRKRPIRSFRGNTY